jgi:hypothetical protein
MMFDKLYNEAHTAGVRAAQNCTVTPMIVGTPKTFLGSELDYSKPVEVVADGVCGFAWVNIKPGNSAFANWLKKKGLARTDSYYGGVTIWVSDYNQSMTRKSAYAGAFARVLNENGYTRAYAMSRMD